jgi:hypothetical protein
LNWCSVSKIDLNKINKFIIFIFNEIEDSTSPTSLSKVCLSQKYCSLVFWSVERCQYLGLYKPIISWQSNEWKKETSQLVVGKLKIEHKFDGQSKLTNLMRCSKNEWRWNMRSLLYPYLQNCASPKLEQWRGGCESIYVLRSFPN